MYRSQVNVTATATFNTVLFEQSSKIPKPVYVLSFSCYGKTHMLSWSLRNFGTCYITTKT